MTKKIIKSEEDSVLTSEFLCQGENKNEKIQFTKVFFKKNTVNALRYTMMYERNIY